MISSHLIVAGLLLWTILSCSEPVKKLEKSPPPPAPAWISPANAITMMTLNLENIFASTENPKADASETETVMTSNLERLAAIVRAAKGRLGADLLVLTGVQSGKTVERLITNHLSDLGYGPAVFLQGKRHPVYNLVVLAKLKSTGHPQIHHPGILESSWRLPNGKILTTFAVQFPESERPPELRIAALKSLHKLRRQAPKDRLVLVAGNFNISREEDQKEKLLERFAQTDWLIAPQLACPSCGRTTSSSASIFLSKDFYDGLLGWRVLPESVRRVPTEIDPGVHGPIALDIVPVSNK